MKPHLQLATTSPSLAIEEGNGDGRITPTLSNPPTAPSEPRPIRKAKEGPLDPDRLARRAKRILQVLFYRDDWYRFDTTHYRKTSQATLESLVHDIIKREIDRNSLLDNRDRAVKVTRHLVADVLLALRNVALVDEHLELPAWLNERSQRRMVSFSNGLLDLDTALRGDGAIEPHDPNYFTTISLPFVYDPNAQAPHWERFISDTMGGDLDKVALVQEVAGYLLEPTNPFQRFFVFEGPAGGGKSTVVNVLVEMLGQANVSAVPLGLLDRNFQLAPMIGKALNVCWEADDRDRPHVGILKAITGGDRVHIDRKYRSPINVRIDAKIVITCNTRPRLVDASGGLWRRMVILPFTNPVPEACMDRGLEDRLKEELAGIFQWAIVGLRRLRERKQFTAPAVVRQALEEYRTEASSVRSFIRSTGLRAGGLSDVMTVELLYNQYRQWCAGNGRDAISDVNFGKELRECCRVSRRHSTALAAGRALSIWAFGSSIRNHPSQRLQWARRTATQGTAGSSCSTRARDSPRDSTSRSPPARKGSSDHEPPTSAY